MAYTPLYTDWGDVGLVMPTPAAMNHIEQGIVDASQTSGVVVSALDFGAKGDGITNDAPAIQAALDSLPVSGGGCVYLPTGRYVIGAPIRLRSHVTLAGSGRNTTLYVKDGANIDAIILASNPAEDVCVRDLRIHGNKLNQSSGRGIVFTTTNASGVWEYDMGGPANTILNVTVYFTKGDGITIDGGANWSGWCRLDGCDVNKCDGIGYLIKGSDTMATGCMAQKSGKSGWEIGPLAGATQLANCLSSDSGIVVPAEGYGFRLRSGLLLLANCKAQHNTRAGYFIQGNNNTMSGCLADSNGYQSTPSPGFEVVDTVQNTVMSGCFSRDSGGYQNYGYQFNNGSDGILVTGMAVANTVAPVNKITAGTKVNTTLLLTA